MQIKVKEIKMLFECVMCKRTQIPFEEMRKTKAKKSGVSNHCNKCAINKKRQESAKKRANDKSSLLAQKFPDMLPDSMYEFENKKYKLLALQRTVFGTKFKLIDEKSKQRLVSVNNFLSNSKKL